MKKRHKKRHNKKSCILLKNPLVMINWREIERIEIRTENIFNTAVIIFDSQGRSSIPPKIKWIDYLKNESVTESFPSLLHSHFSCRHATLLPTGE